MRTLLTLILLFTFASVHAGDKEATGTVQMMANSGKMILVLSGSNTSCGNRYWFTPDTDYNRAMLSMLLTAQAADKQVWVNGMGQCLSGYPYNNAYELANMMLYNN